MSQSIAEVLVLAANALGAGILMFVSGVVQRIMNELSELEFKRFLNQLHKAALGDAFTVTIGTVPSIAALLYFVAYGFRHWWFTAGFAVWMVGSVISKVMNLPIYQWVADPKNTDPAELAARRRKLQTANALRAWISLGSVLLMACQFSVVGVLVATAATVAIAFPMLLLTRRYTPGREAAVRAA